MRTGIRASSVVFLAALFLGRGAFAQDAAQANALREQALAIIMEDCTVPAYLKAIPLLEQAHKLDPKNDLVLGTLSDYYWELADLLPKNTGPEKKVRLEWFNKGIEAGKECLELNPKNPDGIFFYATNLASAGEMVSIVKSIWMFPALKSGMDKVDRVDPDYGQGSVDRFWAEIASRVPNFVCKAVGMAKEDGIADLIKDTKKWPDRFDNFTYLARLQWDLKRKDDALKNLEYVLTHDPEADPTVIAGNYLELDFARKMWKQYTGKEFSDR